MKWLNFPLYLGILYALVVDFIYPGELYQVWKLGSSIDMIEEKNRLTQAQNQEIVNEINAWNEDKEGYLRYHLNYIKYGEKFIVFDKE